MEFPVAGLLQASQLPDFFYVDDMGWMAKAAFQFNQQICSPRQDGSLAAISLEKAYRLFQTLRSMIRKIYHPSHSRKEILLSKIHQKRSVGRVFLKCLPQSTSPCLENHGKFYASADKGLAGPNRNPGIHFFPVVLMLQGIPILLGPRPTRRPEIGFPSIPRNGNAIQKDGMLVEKGDGQLLSGKQMGPLSNRANYF
jgi:hypothetical protein